MHDADVRDVELFVRLPAQAFEFAESHRRVGFIDEVECAPPFRPPRIVKTDIIGRSDRCVYQSEPGLLDPILGHARE